MRPQPLARPAIILDEGGRIDSDRSDVASSRSEFMSEFDGEVDDPLRRLSAPIEGKGSPTGRHGTVQPPRPPSPPLPDLDRPSAAPNETASIVEAVVEGLLQELITEACSDAAPQVKRKPECSVSYAMRVFAILADGWDVNAVLPENRLELVPVPADQAEQCWRKLCFTGLNELLRTSAKWFKPKDRWSEREGKIVSPLMKYTQRDRKELSWADVEAMYRQRFEYGGTLKPTAKLAEGGPNASQMKEQKLEQLLFLEVENEEWGDCTDQMDAIQKELADAIFEDVVEEFVTELEQPDM
jgi:hypothetical protein